MAYVAKDGTPRNIPIAFTWNGTQIRDDGMVRVVVTPTWVKLIDFETTLPPAIEQLVRRRAEREQA